MSISAAVIRNDELGHRNHAGEKSMGTGLPEHQHGGEARSYGNGHIRDEHGVSKVTPCRLVGIMRGRYIGGSAPVREGISQGSRASYQNPEGGMGGGQTDVGNPEGNMGGRQADI